MKLVRSESMSVRDKVARARAELAAALVERDDEVDVVLTALLAGEHVLLVGPPGCGKSLLLDGLLAWAGGRKFSVLLTRFTTPEEVLGPVSLAGLKEDRYVRVTAGKLPEADLAFLDEVLRGSSAVLNCLLKLLNERTFDAGDGVVKKVPLKLCVGAANDGPSRTRVRSSQLSSTGSPCGRPWPRSARPPGASGSCGSGTTRRRSRPP
ncbi:AAA family ATPase [Gemmata sp.]|uniref:AAA family ATPase n=1 Tax=Gemmata sp. TaxID=1914242 RepID=UPI003F705B49